MSVQAAVPEVVWCPANIIEMNMPVMMSALKWSEPSSSLIDMRTSSRSRSSLSGDGLAGPAVHDPLHQLDEALAGAVAQAEALDVGVGVDVGEGIGAPLEVVVQVGEAAVELLAEALADEAGRRRVDRQLGEPVEQVDLAAVRRAGPSCGRPRPRSSRRGRA